MVVYEALVGIVWISVSQKQEIKNYIKSVL